MYNNTNQIKTQFSTSEIVGNRIKFMLKPVTAVLSLPVKGIKKFSDAIVAEAVADLESKNHSEKVKKQWDEYQEQRSSAYNLSIQQLKERAKEQPLDVRIIVNRQNGKKGGRPVKNK